MHHQGRTCCTVPQINNHDRLIWGSSNINSGPSYLIVRIPAQGQTDSSPVQAPFISEWVSRARSNKSMFQVYVQSHNVFNTFFLNVSHLSIAINSNGNWEQLDWAPVSLINSRGGIATFGNPA